MKKSSLLAIALLTTFSTLFAQQKSDSVDLEKLRKESGIDPTRVQSRAGYSFLMYDLEGSAGQINNRLSLNLGVNTWNFSMKYDVISRTTGEPGTGFASGMGDIRFSVLNAFYVEGKHALAASAEFSMPTGKPGFGSQYFSATPAITYSYTIKPSLILAFQPQYTFQLMKDPLYPNLSVLTIRSFLAKFTKTGYFFVFEPRPIFDFGNNTVDFIISPIIGKSLGAGFNLIVLAEIPVTNSYRDNKGILYQLGFNKNF
jgi:Putative MetA-pathway of phenol degradation